MNRLKIKLYSRDTGYFEGGREFGEHPYINLCSAAVMWLLDCERDELPKLLTLHIRRNRPKRWAGWVRVVELPGERFSVAGEAEYLTYGTRLRLEQLGFAPTGSAWIRFTKARV